MPALYLFFSNGAFSMIIPFSFFARVFFCHFLHTNLAQRTGAKRDIRFAHVVLGRGYKLLKACDRINVKYEPRLA